MRFVKTVRLRSEVVVVALLAACAVVISAEAAAADPCAPLINPIACENSRAGTPSSVWNVSGAGSATIQGFATQMSVNVGEIQRFKVSTSATSYRLDIYRMGYYAGNGARHVAVVPGTRQTQPNCLSDASTGLVDCGNWAVSASWTVPADAVSGIYFARLVRTDATAGASHVFFVVRNDSSSSDLLFQTSDTTWQAYNTYGGNSLYVGNPVGRAYKVSYNRPFTTRANAPEDWVFNAEYPMVRFLESNGYDVSYTSGIDTDRRGALLRNHKVFLSVGHDEYWSGPQRTNVEAARDAGVHLAFFSGNEVFWKTRWENSVDGSNTPYRTLVTYKETHAGAPIDPADPPTWTGTWRDPRFSPPGDGGRPENRLTGTIFKVNSGTVNLQVPAADGKMRLWRDTSVANLPAGGTATLGSGTVGYEWDEDKDNGFRPPGLIRLSTTNATGLEVLQDYGSTYGPGSATHHLTLYRAASGALVFGAGTVQWSWGLDSNHDRGSGAASTPMRQATVNLFADMGAQPGTLQSGLVTASQSSDPTGPVTTIAAPANGASIPAGAPITVSGTATDASGVVGGVEVSTDGTSWHPASGRGTWTYTWSPPGPGPVTIRVRSTDDSANIGTPATVSVTVRPRECPCSIWDASVSPSLPSQSDPNAVELGVKFRADVAGQATGVRFFKGSGNTGTHVGHLWTTGGTLLATVTFTGETGSGWQQANFATPVNLTAGTTYVVSYYAPNGRYALDTNYFAASARDNPPLHALRDGTDGPNGLFRYGAGGGFPNSSWLASNYWVDVVFSPAGPDTTAPTLTARTPAPGATGVPTATTVTATFSEPVQPATIAMSLRDSGGAPVGGSIGYDSAARRATFTPAAALAANTTYTATVSGATDLSGNVMSPVSWTFTTVAPPTCPCTIWSPGTTPSLPSQADPNAVEVGVKFRADIAGQATGVRFYKGTGNTGTHVGHLWTSTGQLLATVTFTGETASGWQQANFATPVNLTAGTTYVVSYYAPNGRYAFDQGYFATSGADRPPLHALRDGADGPNGLFRYGTSGGFPNSSWQSSNYWVDVVFSPAGPDTTAPTVTARTPATGATGVPTATTVTATFSEPVQPATVAMSLRDNGGAPVTGSVGYDSANRRATFTPAAALAPNTGYTATVSGATDQAGNVMSAVSWSFTTVAPPTCPCSIWTPTTTPSLPAEADTAAVELGVKFRADVAGQVTGVRFYKGTGNTGTHVGHLWTSTGQLLATVTFTGETATGWQQATFATPVPVTAGTTYVVSYYAPVGRYAQDTGYFAATGTDRPPLHALRDGVDGPNGLFRYGTGGGFPTSSWQSSNYWVDVVFTAT